MVKTFSSIVNNISLFLIFYGVNNSSPIKPVDGGSGLVLLVQHIRGELWIKKKKY
ncbi:MAG: hypothetical protein LBT66_03000 [Methanobrevibacter sp.]|nr:hypothetical protein [Candidatus Methanovirga meridionalis]